MRALLIVGLLCVIVCGCSPRLSGTYLPQGGGNTLLGNVFSKMEFVSGSEVDMTISLSGTASRFKYKVDGKKLVLSAGEQTMIMDIDDKGCIGNQMMGKYCKK